MLFDVQRHEVTNPAEVRLARRWLAAYGAHRDDEMLALAHPDIVVRPRRGQAGREYRGREGVRRWLADAGDERHVPDDLTIDMTTDGRAVVELRIADTPVVAVLEFRDSRVCGVSAYLSDREMLEELGVIPPLRG